MPSPLCDFRPRVGTRHIRLPSPHHKILPQNRTILKKEDFHLRRRYTKEDCQGMPENLRDHLPPEYGLPADSDLAYKGYCAIGAFPWPEFNRCSSRNASPEPSSPQSSSPNSQI
ncbi:hypothetical protein RJ641_036013 [Dillenia turbinata]|uniref:DUF7722 domain-containing protein n=1 Tax=Dillenia turbinata TaxID=194707 RepID=A0AAN8ZAM1_9MAGN